MRKNPFGPTGRLVPVIGQGTWSIDEADRSSAALRRGLDRGMSHIDTAEMYGDAEIIVGEAIKGRRDEVFLVSKVLPQNGTRRRTIAACDRSLARLGTDRLDCYLLHWRGPVPLEETFAAFEELRAAGKILSWGVSNFDEPDLDDALNAAGPHRMTCNQVLYNLQVRAVEHAVLPWCERHGVALVGYTPFGQGEFPDAGTREGQSLAKIASAHRATARQIALAFLTRRRSLFAIPKASNPLHTEENAGAGEIQLSDDEIELIDATFPVGPRPRTLPMI